MVTITTFFFVCPSFHINFTFYFPQFIKYHRNAAKQHNTVHSRRLLYDKKNELSRKFMVGMIEYNGHAGVTITIRSCSFHSVFIHYIIAILPI